MWPCLRSDGCSESLLESVIYGVNYAHKYCWRLGEVFTGGPLNNKKQQLILWFKQENLLMTPTLEKS